MGGFVLGGLLSGVGDAMVSQAEQMRADALLRAEQLRADAKLKEERVYQEGQLAEKREYLEGQATIKQGRDEATAEAERRFKAEQSTLKRENALDVARIKGTGLLSGVSASTGASSPGVTAQGVVPPGETALGAVEDATGPTNWLKESWNIVTGPFRDDLPWPGVAEAKQRLKVFNTELKKAFHNEGKGPTDYEQKLLADFMVDPKAFWSDPERARSHLLVIRDYMVNKRNLKQQTLSEGGITKKEGGNLANEIKAIERAIALLGVDFSKMSLDELESIDETALTPAQLKAAEARHIELSHGKQ